MTWLHVPSHILDPQAVDGLPYLQVILTQQLLPVALTQLREGYLEGLLIGERLPLLTRADTKRVTQGVLREIVGEVLAVEFEDLQVNSLKTPCFVDPQDTWDVISLDLHV